MSRKKSEPLGVIGVVIAAMLAFIAAVPKDVWIVIGIGAGAYVAYKIYLALTPSPPVITSPPETTSNPSPLPDELQRMIARSSAQPVADSYRIPPKPTELKDNAMWFGKDESVTVNGFKLDAGMVYIGNVLRDIGGNIEPALIGSSLPISVPPPDHSGPSLPYWPRYSEISSQARGTYLQWLADGRKDPRIDAGYVFLFFYGLERRVIVDIVKDVTLKPELIDILVETRRLLTLYGEQSHSVRNYLSKFISMLELMGAQEKSYAEPLPTLSAQNEVPYYLRLALGQAAVDGVPVPAALALAWAECDPTISRRLPTTRCQDAFRRLFLLKYRDVHGEGLKLSINKTKLKLVYVPASPAFSAAKEIALQFGDVPDVTLVTAPIRKLQALVDASTAPLERLSRYLGRNPDKTGSLDSLLLLPPDLWADGAKEVIAGIQQRMGSGMMTLTLKDLADLLGGGSLTQEKVLGVASALQSMQIGMEPDVLNGAKTPKAADKVVLFHMEPDDIEAQLIPEYHLAILKLQLAVAVAKADGDFSAAELRHIVDQIPQWSHLQPAHNRRLRAHLRLLRESPFTLAVLAKKLAPLDQASRETISVFAASIAQSDGAASILEMKFLEKLNQALGIDASILYRTVHEGAIQKPVQTDRKVPQVTSGMALDANRIAELQRDSERVAQILSNIFIEEAPLPAAEPATPLPPTAPSLLGLEEPYARFLQTILARPVWTRNELRDVAEDLELMLDGALERINEAAFDHFDIPCTEGDDPIDVNHEFREKVEQ